MDQAFLSSLEETLKQITNPQTVNEATERLQKQYYTHAQVVPALVQILQVHPQQEVRQLAGVEARKIIADKWLGLDESYKNEIRSSLLPKTIQEQSPLVRHTMARVISEIATTDLSEMLSGENKWPDLLPYLFNAIKSSSTIEREVAIYVMYTLVESDVDPLKQNKAELLKLYATTINDDSLQVRVSTVLGLQAMSDLIDVASLPKNLPRDQNPVELFRELIPACVQVLQQSITAGDEKGTSDVFEFFTNLLVVDSALVSKHLGQLVDFMMNKIALEPQLDEENRLCGLRFLINAVMYKKTKLQTLKLGPQLAQASMQIMAEGFDEDDDDEDLEDTPPGMAFRLLEGLANHLPPNQVVAPLLEAFPQYAQGNPGQRRAAFNAVTATVEGAPDFMANQVENVLPVVMNGLQDSDKTVVASALFSLSELTLQLQELISDKHDVLLPMVCSILDQASTLKIGKYACHALDALLDNMDRKIITHRYLDSLLPKLLQLLDGAQNLSLKSAIVAAISSAANSAGPAFYPYFEHTCRSVQSFIKTPAAGEEELPSEEVALCGITLDLLSAIASAVGRDNFRPFMEPLVMAAFNCIQCDQPRMKECGFIFIGTIARVYAEEFSKYLTNIVPEVFKSLEQDEMAGLLESFENNNETIGMDDDDDNDEKFAVTNSIINEKEFSIEALGEIIAGTKKDFMPYLERACELLAENCSHYHTPLASAAVNALWKAFGTFYKLAHPEKWTQGFPAQYNVSDPAASIGAKARDESLQRLSEAEDRSIAISICDRFAEAIRLAGPWVLGSNDEFERLFGEVLMILNKTHPSQTMEDEFDYDTKPSDDEEQESSEYDEVLIDSALDVLVQLAAAVGELFVPLWPTLMPTMEKFCNNPKSKNERASGIGAIAEIINGLKGYCTEQTTELYQLIFKCLDDRDLEVRSNAAYGAGLLVYYSQQESFIQSNLMNVLQKLQRLLKKVEKKQAKFGNVVDESDTNEGGLANACGCVARMALRYPNQVPIDQVMPALLEHLPLKSSFEENEPIFELFVTQFQQQNETVVNMRAQIVDIFDQVFAQQAATEADVKSKPTPPVNAAAVVYPFANDEIKGKVVNLLKYLESQESGSVSSKSNLAAVL